MIDLYDTTHNRPNGKYGYTRSEYDNLTGYVTRTYQMEWTDAQGTRWRKTCTVINLGRPDRGTPVDPDAQLGDESAEQDKIDRERWRSLGNEAVARKAAQRQVEMRNQVIAHLMEHGPTHQMGLVHDLGWKRTLLDKHLRENTGILYVMVGKVGKAKLWGVKGVHDASE